MKRRQVLAAGAAAAAAPWAGAATPLPALQRGLNLTHWFEYERSQVVAPAELRALRAAGFDHVRLPVDPVVLGWTPGELSAQPDAVRWAPVRQALLGAFDAGLAAVFDLHLTPQTRQLIEADAALEPALAALWSQIALALADLPPAQLAFELFNEPQYYGRHAHRWPPLQRELLRRLRAQAPAHAVLLSGNEGGSLAGLRRLPAVDDGAAAYTFHYYEPFLFTHQGAHWLDRRYTSAGLIGNLHYPASAQGSRAPTVSGDGQGAAAARELGAYLGRDGRPPQGSTARVQADLAEAGAYARLSGRRLLCTEFGAIRANVDAASRYRWMADVRQALEAERLGWTLWDYTDLFGITDGAALRRVEPAALQALGMAAPPGSRP